jgi:hypothetical protein
MAYTYSRKRSLSNEALNPNKDFSSQPKENRRGTNTPTKQAEEKKKKSKSGGGSSTPRTETPANTGQNFTPLPPSQSIDTGKYSVKTIKDSKNNVIAVEDPITMQSIPVKPTTEAEIRKLEQQRAQEIIRAGGSFQEAPAQTKNKPQEEIRYLRVTEKKTTGQKIKESFTEGFREASIVKRAGDYLGSGNIADNPFNKVYSTKLETIAGTAGAATGFIFDMATLSGGGAASSQLPAKVTMGVSTRVSSVQNAANTIIRKGTINPFLAVPTNIVGGTVTALATSKAAETAINVRRNVGLPSTKLDKTDKEVFNIARQAERKARKGIAQSVGFEIGLSNDEQTFLNAANKELNKRGVKNAGERLERLRETRIARQGGSLAGTLGAGVFSERAGSAAVGTALSKGATPKFSTFALNIAPAGFGEGFSQQIISNKNVGDTRNFFTGQQERLIKLPTPQALAEKTPEMLNTGLKFSTTPFIESTAAGAFGAITAGTLGGIVATTATKGQKARSKVAETIGYLLDPTEKPSDIISDAVFRTRTPIITPTPVPALTQSSAAKKKPTQTLNSFTSSTSTFTPTSNTPIPVNLNIFGYTQTQSITPAPVPIPSESFTPIPLPVDTPVPVDTPTQTQTPVDTPVPVPVNTNTPVNMPVLVTNPIEKGFPPFFRGFNFGGGGAGGGGRKQRVKFVNELDIGKQVLSDLTGRPAQRKHKRSINKMLFG